MAALVVKRNDTVFKLSIIFSRNDYKGNLTGNFVKYRSLNSSSFCQRLTVAPGGRGSLLRKKVMLSERKPLKWDLAFLLTIKRCDVLQPFRVRLFLRVHKQPLLIAKQIAVTCMPVTDFLNSSLVMKTSFKAVLGQYSYVILNRFQLTSRIVINSFI